MAIAKEHLGRRPCFSRKKLIIDKIEQATTQNHTEKKGVQLARKPTDLERMFSTYRAPGNDFGGNRLLTLAISNGKLGPFSQ